MITPNRFGAPGNPKYTVLRQQLHVIRQNHLTGEDTLSDEIGYVIYEHGVPIHFTLRCRDAYRWIEAQS